MDGMLREFQLKKVRDKLGWNFTVKRAAYAKDHGFIFECEAKEGADLKALRVKAKLHGLLASDKLGRTLYKEVDERSDLDFYIPVGHGINTPVETS